jgi:hypothetical protein
MTLMVVEIRDDDMGRLDEIIAHGCTVHVERMNKNSWFLGITASDGSYWQFWFGAEGRRVECQHREMTP